MRSSVVFTLLVKQLQLPRVEPKSNKLILRSIARDGHVFPADEKKCFENNKGRTLCARLEMCKHLCHSRRMCNSLFAFPWNAAIFAKWLSLCIKQQVQCQQSTHKITPESQLMRRFMFFHVDLTSTLLTLVQTHASPSAEEKSASARMKYPPATVKSWLSRASLSATIDPSNPSKTPGFEGKFALL